ncbi:MAG: hypothetical protein Q8Q37_01520 [bacterium]|nr:hypothetical protein [bacterium]
MNRYQKIIIFCLFLILVLPLAYQPISTGAQFELSDILLSEELSPPQPGSGIEGALNAPSTEDTDDELCLTFGCALRKFLGWALTKIAYFFSYVASLLIALAGAFITFLVDASKEITSNGFVTTGFGLTLQIANLGFVLAMIFIGIATILRLENYKTKDLLRKLIIAAVLINFSFAIVGVFLDFANIIGNFFLNGVTGQGGVGALATKLAGSLDIQKLTDAPPVTLNNVHGLEEFANVVVLLGALALIAIFNAILVIVFYVTAFLLLLRNIWLMILLIVMPIVWLFWIFPGLSKHWTDWWGKFISWTFFYPAVMFFIYLSINASDQIEKSVGTSVNNADATTALASGIGVDTDSVLVFLALLAKSGILVGGLIAAQKIGIAAAGAGIAAAGAVKGWALGKAGKYTGASWAVKKAGFTPKWAGGGKKGPDGGPPDGGGGGGFGSSGISRKLVTSNAWKGAADTLSRFAPTRGMAADMYRATGAPKKAVEARQSEIEKQKQGKEEMMVNAARARSPEEKAAYANILAKSGNLESFRDDARYGGLSKLDELLNAARDSGNTKDVLENAPQYADHVTTRKPDQQNLNPAQWIAEAIGAAMEKFRPSNVTNLSPEAIRVVGRHFRRGHLEKLERGDGSVEQLRALEDVANAIRDVEPSNPVVRFVDNNIAQQRVTEATDQLRTNIRREEPKPRPPGF